MGILRVFQMVSGIALGLATCIGVSGQTAATTKGEATHMSIQQVHVQRVNIVTTEPFDTVVARIDAQIGHPDMTAFRKSLSAAQNEAEMEKVVNAVTQPNGVRPRSGSPEREWDRQAKNSPHRCGQSADHEGNGEACC